MVKYIYTLAFICFGFSSAFAQNCTGCTTTLTGTVSTPQTVLFGQKLCISPGATLTGVLAIVGGEVCNEGSIESLSIAISSGGILHNYGTISYPNLTMHGIGIDGSTLHNHGTINSGQVAIAGTNSVLINESVLNMENFAFGAGLATAPPFPVGTNNGTMDVAISFGMDSATFDNNGNLTVGVMANGDNGNFSNHQYMSIGQDIGNSGQFYTVCMIPVGNDFANSGVMTGPTTGCGGFEVVGVTGNSGDYAADNSFLDFCDQSGNTGFDGNTGTLGANVTHCQCSSNCMPISGVDEVTNNSLIAVYPNPFTESAILDLPASNGNYTFELYNYAGSLIRSENSITGETYRIERNDLASGFYQFKLIQNNGKTFVGKLIVR
jgi:hypothetical protein